MICRIEKCIKVQFFILNGNCCCLLYRNLELSYGNPTHNNGFVSLAFLYHVNKDDRVKLERQRHNLLPLPMGDRNGYGTMATRGGVYTAMATQR